MASRPIVLLPEALEPIEVGGLFRFTADVDGLPTVAFTPHGLLRTLIKSARVYGIWARANGCTVVPLRKMFDDDGEDA